MTPAVRYQRRIYAERRAAAQCTKCGTPSAASLCTRCNTRRLPTQRADAAERRARRVAAGSCYRCGAAGISFCAECATRQRETRRNRRLYGFPSYELFLIADRREELQALSEISLLRRCS